MLIINLPGTQKSEVLPSKLTIGKYFINQNDVPLQDNVNSSAALTDYKRSIDLLTNIICRMTLDNVEVPKQARVIEHALEFICTSSQQKIDGPVTKITIYDEAVHTLNRNVQEWCSSIDQHLPKEVRIIQAPEDFYEVMSLAIYNTTQESYNLRSVAFAFIMRKLY